jgi:hypothetical protein
MTNRTYQQQYWNQLVELHVHVRYLYYYAVNAEWRDRSINIILAIASSGSIAAWALWKELVFIWPSIIALSQVISAIKPFLPYKSRQKALTELNGKLQFTFLSMEKDWYDVSEGNLTDREVHDLTIKYRDETLSAEQSIMKDTILPEKKDLLTKSEQDAQTYFNGHYFNGGN